MLVVPYNQHFPHLRRDVVEAYVVRTSSNGRSAGLGAGEVLWLMKLA